MTSNPASVGGQTYGSHPCFDEHQPDCGCPDPVYPPASVGPAPDGLLPCPFCGGEAKTYHWNGALQAQCAQEMRECAGTDVIAPVAMWNTRAPHPDREAEPTGGVVEGIATALSGAFITTVSFGDPDPARRSAEVRIVFSGERPAAKAHAAHDAILQALSVSPPVVEGSLRASPCVPTEQTERAVIHPVFWEAMGRQSASLHTAMLAGALRALTKACEDADADEELPEHVDGSLLDDANRALASYEAARHQPTTPGEQGEEG